MVLIVHINLGMCMVVISSGPGRFTITSVTIGEDHDLISVTFVQVSHVTTCYILHKRMHLFTAPVLVHDFNCIVIYIMCTVLNHLLQH